MPSRKPKRTPKKPKITSIKPKRTPKKPKITSRKTKITSIKPKRTPKKPKITSRKTKHRKLFSPPKKRKSSNEYKVGEFIFNYKRLNTLIPKQHDTIISRPTILMPESTNDINVYELDDELFEEVRKGGSHTVLIEYYASWCGACTKFKPVYEELGEYYKKLNAINYERYAEQGNQTIIARVDADKYSDIAVQNDITSFPTIILYVIHKVGFGKNEYKQFIYSGPRTVTDLINFIEENRQDNTI